MSSTAITKGKRRLTPSTFSGNIRVIPTPPAAFSNLGILAGSVTLTSGVSPLLNPAALSGKVFQTDYWVTVTKASGSTSPSNNALMVQETAPSSGTFWIKDIGASSNDDVNFIIVFR